VTVSAPAVAITGFTANPSTVKYGGNTTLSWSSSNATGCTASNGWSGAEPTSGTFLTGDLKSTTTFTLTCTNSNTGSTAQQSTQVSVSAAAPSLVLTATPTSVTTGGSSTLQWTATNAVSCTPTGAWPGNPGVTGAQSTGPLTATTTYTLACTNGAGATATASVTITVASGSANLSWTAPTQNTNGTPVTPLSGYVIYYGQTQSQLLDTKAVSGATTTTASVTGLTAGTWYFEVAAVAADGTQSPPSSAGTKTF